jgi:hypothetical protein
VSAGARPPVGIWLRPAGSLASPAPARSGPRLVRTRGSAPRPRHFPSPPPRDQPRAPFCTMPLEPPRQSPGPPWHDGCREGESRFWIGGMDRHTPTWHTSEKGTPTASCHFPKIGGVLAAGRAPRPVAGGWTATVRKFSGWRTFRGRLGETPSDPRGLCRCPGSARGTCALRRHCWWPERPVQ